MKKSKYEYLLVYSSDRKTIELAKILNVEGEKTKVLKSKKLNPEHVAWVLIHYLKGNNLKEIKTKFGTLELKEEGEQTSDK